MQQPQKSKSVPQKNLPASKAQPSKAGPVAVDEKALRQIAGGILQIPNGGW